MKIPVIYAGACGLHPEIAAAEARGRCPGSKQEFTGRESGGRVNTGVPVPGWRPGDARTDLSRVLFLIVPDP
jgi:hypothetical protein